MKLRETTVQELLKTYLPTASADEIDAAVERVLRRSPLETEIVSPVNPPASSWLRSLRSRSLVAVAGMAMLVIGIGILWIARTSAGDAVVQSVDGRWEVLHNDVSQTLLPGSRLHDGDLLRSGDDSQGALVLSNGSSIEVRSGSELLMTRGDGGSQIRLNRGSILATSSKSEPLPLQTQDITLSVTGVVSLTQNETGAQVAVVQGETLVRFGELNRRLLPGMQLSTSAKLRPLSVYEQIAWSRSAPAHLAVLRQSVEQQAAAATGLQFEAVSIRAVEPRDIPAEGAVGFACHGIDGMRRALFGREELVVPLGRCVGVGNVFISDVVGFAYGQLGSARVLGGPEWVRPVPFPLRRGRTQPALFQIQAVAADPAHTTLDQLTEMLRSMLADRFKLQAHREAMETPGWALIVTKTGSKLKEVPADGSQESPYPFPDGRGAVTVRGKSQMDRLAEILGRILDSPIIDNTGLSGIYDYEIQVLLLADTGERGAPGERGIPAIRPASDIASEVSRALESRLGLTLRKEKSVPMEIIVIDHMEMPSPN